MKGHADLNKNELIELVRSLESELKQTRAADAPPPSMLELDFVSGQALKVLDNSGIPAFVYEAEGASRLLASNERMAALSGYSQDELRGMKLAALLAEDDRERVERLLALPRQGGMASAGCWRLRTRSGEIREVEVSGYDLSFNARLARFTIVQDVTQRRRDQLMQQRLASIVQTSRDAILSRTVDGIVLSWNKAAERLFGFGAADIVGRSDDPLFPPTIQESEKEFIRNRILAGEFVENEETVRLSRDGAPIDVAVSIAPLRDGEGAIIGASCIMRDIRDRKEAERKLEQSHERLRKLAELSYDWCWEQDENLRFVYHSGELSPYRELMPRAMMGRSRFELPIIWLSEAQKEQHARLLAERKPFKDLEYRLRDPGARELTFTESGEPIFDSQGRFRGYRGIGRDITERKRQEESLRLLSAIVGSTDDAIVSWSQAGAILSWNPGAEAMLGYKSEEVLGHGIALLLPVPGGSDELTTQVLAGEKVLNQETVRRHKNSTMIPVSVTCSPLRDNRGRVIAISCIARDIRRQKLQERLLSENYQRLKLALESADLSLWDWDIPAPRVHYDEAFGRLTGYSPNELSGATRPWEGLIHPDDATMVNRRFEAPLSSGNELCDTSFRVRSKSGQWLWVAVRGKVVSRDRNGGPLRMMGTCQDITQSRQAEETRQMLSAFVDASDDAIITRSLEGEVLTWNRGAEKIYGFGAAEVLGGSHLRLYPAERLQEEKRINAAVLAGETMVGFETVRRHKGGRAVHVSVTFSPLTDGAGRVIGIASISRDITGRVRAESSRQLLANIVTSSRDTIMSRTLEGTVLSWNPAAEQMFGYAAAEIVGRDHEILYAPEEVWMAKEVNEAVARGESIINRETRRRHKDGRLLDVSVSVFPLVDKGRIIGVSSITRDIGDQKRAQVALRASEQRFRSLVEASAEIVWITDAEGRVLPESSSWQRYTGLSFEDTRGDGWIRAVHAEDREHTLQRWSAALRSGSVFECEHRVRRADGQWRFMSVRAAPVRKEDGAVREWIGVHTDITGRREAESAGRLLVAVVESSQDAIVSHSLEGAILSWNRAAVEMFGYSPHEVIGQHCSLLTPQIGAEQVLDMRQRIERGERIAPYETQCRHKDGRLFPVSVTLAALHDEHERIVGVAAVCRDVEMQKRLELLMRRTQATARVGGWEVDCQTWKLFWTEETYRIHETTPETYTPTVESAIGFYAPEAVPVIQEAMENALQHGKPFDVELPLITARGNRIWVRAIGEAQRENDRVVRIYGSFQDICDRRRIEDALRESERYLESIVTNAAEGIVVLSPDGAIERFNLVAQRMFGYSAAEAGRLNLRQLALDLFVSGDKSAQDSQAGWVRHLLGSRRELTGQRKDGALFPLELALSEISMVHGQNRFAAVVRDITERKSWEGRIYNLAYSDSLTGLPNRLLLRDRLEHAIAAGQRNRSLVGVLFFDLDRFKAVNDSYGHHVGDQLLREIGGRARECVREIDTVSRLGGDEFVVILPELRDTLAAGLVARKILSALSQTYTIHGHEIAITPTVGISIYPNDGQEADTLLRNADTAMYHAKQGGRNSFRFFGSEIAG